VNEKSPQAAPVPDGYSVVTEHDGTPRAVIAPSGSTRAHWTKSTRNSPGTKEKATARWRIGGRPYALFQTRMRAPGTRVFSQASGAARRFELL